MRILLAPDSFKSCATAFEVCQYAQAGIHQTGLPIHTVLLPMADGGEGSLDVVLASQRGEKIWTTVQNPLGKPVQTYWGWFSQTQTAIIEMAKASGLMLLEERERNPLYTNTFGTGQLIKEAIQKGAKHVVVFIGGSATNDAGAGMLQALGVRFLDNERQPIPRLTGGNLSQIAFIDTSEMCYNSNQVSITVACDVTNPLLGKYGASRVFAPQKGADAAMVEILEKNLMHFAQLTGLVLEKDDASKPGSGAAGGLGFALMAYCSAHMKKGAETIWDIIQGNQFLEQLNSSTDLVITGEGRIDKQTLYGKVPVTVARFAKLYQIPVVGICGSYAADISELYEFFCGIYSILSEPSSLENAITRAPQWISYTVANITRTWYASKTYFRK
ncbi:MAG: glycerate kinase [Cytophagales bacterium]|nr:glycerate kinase [Cytophagales bacterium]MDW8384090.1 glycerate kinase [Flammeovirgaceae bacterium]